MIKKFDYHKPYDITELAKKYGNYENCYIKFYLYRDNKDIILYRLMEGNYNDSNDKYTIEVYRFTGHLITTLKDDDLSCDEYLTFNSIEEIERDIISQGQEIEKFEDF